MIICKEFFSVQILLSFIKNYWCLYDVLRHNQFFFENMIVFFSSPDYNILQIHLLVDFFLESSIILLNQMNGLLVFCFSLCIFILKMSYVSSFKFFKLSNAFFEIFSDLHSSFKCIKMLSIHARHQIEFGSNLQELLFKKFLGRFLIIVFILLLFKFFL